MAYNIDPQTTIYLIKTKLESDYENTYHFTSKENQTNYFNGLAESDSKTFSRYTYVKKDKYVVVDGNIDNLISYNYLFYENYDGVDENFEPIHKRYYCFINKMEYVNENATRIYFDTDVMQTYMFDMVFSRCFVEREHVNNDTVGLHTIPEGLETGDYILNGAVTIPSMASAHVVVGSTVDLVSVPTNDAMLDKTGGSQFGVFSGLGYYLFRNTEDVNNMLKRVAHHGKSSGITLMFMAPDSLTDYNNIAWNNHQVVDTYADTDYYCFKMGETTGALLIPALTQNIAKKTSLNGYTPKNNKLLTYPYNYLNVTNFNGCDVQYRYEYFSGNTCNFQGNGVINAGCSINLVPTNYQEREGSNTKYKGIFEIPCGKYPVCSWASDYYTNWLSQNGLNIKSQFMQGATALLSGIGAGVMGSNAGNIVGGIQNSFNQISNTIAQMDYHQMQANSIEGNTNSGDINFSEGYIGFGFYPMSIKAEFARIIDNYFSMYGYKVHTVKVPNITSRRYWNFIKTVKCNVDGNIPQEDLAIIRTNFNNGITFWHDPANIYNYNLNNTIV